MKKKRQKQVDKTLRPIQEVLEQHKDAFMAMRGVSGIGASLRNNKPCIKIFINSDAPPVKEKIPAMIQGYKVVTIKTGNTMSLDRGSKR